MLHLLLKWYWTNPVWYPNWFNEMSELCPKLIQFNIQFKIVCLKIISKYHLFENELRFNLINHSIQNISLKFISMNYSIPQIVQLKRNLIWSIVLISHCRSWHILNFYIRYDIKQLLVPFLFFWRANPNFLTK